MTWLLIASTALTLGFVVLAVIEYLRDWKDVPTYSDDPTELRLKVRGFSGAMLVAGVVLCGFSPWAGGATVLIALIVGAWALA